MSTVGTLRDEIVLAVHEDWFGLYEVYGQLDAGDVHDDDFGSSRCAPWEAARDVVLELYDEGAIRVVDFDAGVVSSVPDGRSAITNKSNWMPFGMVTGRGFALELVE